MQEVVIKIKGDSSDIVKLGNELKNLGKIDQENAKQFKKTNDDFKKGAKESKSALSEVLSEVTDIRGQLINLGKTLVSAFAVEAVINFGKESVKAFMEAELNANKLKTAITTIGGEGSQAFNKLIEQSSILQDKGIFSDDAIQSAQTQLAQYGLFSKEIEDIIPLIADMASATGMDLGQATDMVISGLNGMTRGLKSVGIEFKDTGNIAGNYQEVLKGLNKFHGQMDSVMETSTGKLQNFGNRWEDFKEQIGGAMMSMMGGAKAAKDITKDFDNQVNSVIKLQQNIIPLANRYDELSKKGKLSKDEQKELNKAIEEISMVVPGAISSIDNYGKAIGINTQRVREYLKNEVDRLKAVNAEAIEDLEDARKKQDNIIKLHQKQIDQYLRGEKVTALGSSFELSDEQIQDIRTKYNKALSLRNGYNQEIARLNGDYLKKEIDARQKEAENLKKAQAEREAAFKAEQEANKKKEAAKESDKKRIDEKKEELTTLEALQKAYDKLAKAVDRNAQSGKVDRDMIQERDEAQKALAEGTFKYEQALLEINGMKAISRKEIQAVEIDEKAKFDEQKQMMEKAHQNKMNQIVIEGASVRKMTAYEEIMATSRILIDSGQLLVDSLNLQGQQAKDAQKGFALANLAFSTAEAIANIVKGASASSAQVAAASGPLAPITGPAAFASFMSQLVTVFANLIQAKQIIMGYKDGTPSLQRNGNPKGVDTIPIMANEGEAIIPTDKNRQKPGLAAAWIKGNLDDYINVNYVIPALKRNKIDKDEAFASRIGKAISMSASFNDMNLLQSDKENRRILRSIDKTLKSGSMGLSRRKF